MTFAEQVRALGDALVERGLTEKRGFGQTAWQGAVGGRACAVHLSRASRTRYVGEVRTRKHLGYKLRIRLATGPSVRLFFVRRRIADSRPLRLIYRFKRQGVLEHGATELSDFRVVARDLDWAARLVADPEAVRCAARLLGVERSDGRISSLYFGPALGGGRIYYASPILQEPEIHAEHVVGLLAQLEALAVACEALPPPASPARPGRFERLAEEKPYVAAFGCLGCVLLGLASAGSVGALLLFLYAVARDA